MRRAAALLLLAAACAPCRAAAPLADIVQQPGAALPMSAPLVEADGATRTFGQVLAGHPAVLMFGYYRCRNLCSTSLDALARALQTAGLHPGSDAEVLFLSVDPQETPALAAQKQQLYARAFAAAQPQRWHFLTASADSIARLSEATGFRYRRDARSGEYIHAAGLVIVAPDGRIASYLPGLATDPEALRMAVSGAAHGRIGALAGRVLVLCSHLGTDGSARSRDVLRLIQGLSVAGLSGLALLLWRRTAREKRGA